MKYINFRQLLLAGLFVALTGGCTATGTSSSNNGDVIGPRPEQDVARDASRQPFAVLDYLGVEPGMTVLDVIAAGGYYTEALANAVGLQGRVYAQNPAAVLRFRGGANDFALQSRLSRLPNVRRLDREFDDLGLVDNSVDVAITALNFHDVYNQSPDLAHNMLLTVKAVLKPGGVLGLIDHHGDAGADNAKLHRMLVEDAVAAAERAGFQVERSDLLANPADDRSQFVFAEGVRGQTDRFLLKLTKPAS